MLWLTTAVRRFRNYTIDTCIAAYLDTTREDLRFDWSERGHQNAPNNMISSAVHTMEMFWSHRQYSSLTVCSYISACELKSSLYSFVVTILLHALLLVLEIMYTCWLTQKRGCCACEFVTIKTFCHIAGGK